MKWLTTCVVLLAASVVSAGSPVIEKLRSISYTVETNSGSGSCVAFVRGEHTFAWTAAHVVDGLRQTKSTDGKTTVTFEDAEIVVQVVDGGRTVGEDRRKARIIRYDEERDLAVLHVRQKKYCDSGVVFDLSGNLLDPGDDIIHVGSMNGAALGANSVTIGHVSVIGRMLGTLKHPFTQLDISAYPGSSGGPVVTKECGKCVGLITRGVGVGLVYAVPVRVMHAWCKETDTEYLINADIPMPSEADLSDLPIEGDAGKGASETDEMLFPTLLHTKEPHDLPGI